MLTSLAVVAALSSLAADSGELTLTNVRTTFGVQGPLRAEPKLLPGDSLCIAFDINGVKTDANGKVQYSTAMEIRDRAEKVIYRQAARPLEVINSLGGDRLPAFIHLDVGLEEPPGDYTVKVTVTDRATNSSQSLTRPFKVLDKSFGLVHITTTSDNQGKTPVAVPGVGESVWVNFGIVGFSRQKGQPHLQLEMRIFDDTGKPTTTNPFAGAITKDVPEKALAAQGQFLLSLNRPGKFRVELKAIDQFGKKTSEITFPITVVAPQ
jgi:hypothetical protein